MKLSQTLAALWIACTLGVVAQDQAINQNLKELVERAEKGDPKAQLEVGKAYAEGKIAQKDPAEAVKWFRKAAEQGDARAQAELGLAYSEGKGVAKDVLEAVKWLKSSADQNNPEGEAFLGWMYIHGKGVQKNPAEAVNLFRKSADQGNAFGQRMLGTIYFNGDGVAKNADEAFKWLTKSAEQGEDTSQWLIGMLYYQGLGTSKNEKEAVKWFIKSSEQGNANGLLSLGKCYLNGHGIRRNRAEGIKLIQKAGDSGDPKIQYSIGAIFATGEGVGKDLKEAMKWFRKAAEQGDPAAQADLGLAYFYGQEMPKDGIEALKWWRKAAEKGEPRAQLWIGQAYGNGELVPRDEIEAYKWFLLSAAQGNLEAKNLVAFVETRLTPSQRAEGQRAAREWGTSVPEKRDRRIEGETALEPSQKPIGSGTAFAVTEDGFFITNEHVVRGGKAFTLVTASGTFSAKVLSIDEANDLALLKAELSSKPLPIAPSRSVRLGASVATVGFPNTTLQGFSPKLAKGEIASLAGLQDDPRRFQVSIPVQPGNSGGPMVDDRGNVVGVIVSKLNQSAALATTGTLAENVNYAIKSGFLLSFLESAPKVAASLREPRNDTRPFEDVVEDTKQSTALVLVY